LNIVKGFDKKNDAVLFYRNIGKIITAYVTSTGDISLMSASRIINDYNNVSRKEGKNFNISNFYIQYVLPVSIYKLGYPVKPISEMSVNEIINIEQHIKTISNNNKFYTHSFNGALENEISSNGLDISKEMFSKEIASLAKLTGKTPFKTGKLCYVELGEHSFQYAMGSPEKIYQMLNYSTINKQHENETLHEYYKRCLEELLNTSSLSQEEKKEIYDNGMKIIDYYYSQDKSCIAIIDNQSSDIYPDFIRITYNSFLGLKSSIFSILKYDKQIGILYSEVEKALNSKTPNCLELLEEFRKEFNSKYPQNKTIELMLQQQVTKVVTESCLNNFSHTGFGDGFVVPTGKVSPEKISIATFTNINDLYVRQSLEREKEEVEKNYMISIEEVKKILNTEMSAKEYYVDPNMYNGIPYPVPKDKSVLAKEEGILYKKLEQLWFDGVIDLKKKNELRSIINREYAKMKANAPIPQQSKTTQASSSSNYDEYNLNKITSEQVEPFENIRIEARMDSNYDNMSDEQKKVFDRKLEEIIRLRKQRSTYMEKYGYDDMTDDEKEQFDKMLDEWEKVEIAFRERLNGQGIDPDQLADYNKLVTEEFEKRKQDVVEETEQIERSSHIR